MVKKFLFALISILFTFTLPSSLMFMKLCFNVAVSVTVLRFVCLQIIFLMPLERTHHFASLCLTRHHSTKAYWGSGGIAPRILWPWH
jgi:hypothetical protein